MANFDFDFFVIGAGSGGVRAARIAASHGARVGVAEVARLGGTCVNVGCVPKKLLVYASEFASAFEDAPGFGWERVKPRHNFGDLMRAQDAEIRRLNGIYEKLLVNAGVEILRGRAAFEGPHQVRVGDRVLTAKHILIATGGRPQVPEIPGKELALVSDDIFELREMPRRITVVGGGYIAVEFAGIFNGLGAEVDLVYRGDCVLRGFDQEVREALSEALAGRGIRLHYNTTPSAIHEEADGLRVSLTNDKPSLRTDVLLMATGRVPNVQGLGLELAGVPTDARGVIPVDRNSRTAVSHIYAVGDVTDRVTLTPVAIAEGHAVADALFGNEERQVDHGNVPSAVFSQPSVATVGLTEEEARAQYGELLVFRSRFRPMKNTLSGREERSFMKLIVDAATDRLLGCHMVGPDAGEIMQGFGVAIRCGASKADLDRTIGIHPTAAEEFVTMRTPS